MIKPENKIQRITLSRSSEDREGIMPKIRNPIKYALNSSELSILLEEKPNDIRRETARISMAGNKCLVLPQQIPLVAIQHIKVASKAEKYKEFSTGKANEEIKGRMNIRVSNKRSIMI